MNLITIDGQQYNPQDLSEESRAHLAHLAFIETELQRQQMAINVLRISRQKIGELLRATLPVAPGTAAPAASGQLAPAPAASADSSGKAPSKSGKTGRK